MRILRIFALYSSLVLAFENKYTSDPDSDAILGFAANFHRALSLEQKALEANKLLDLSSLEVIHTTSSVRDPSFSFTFPKNTRFRIYELTGYYKPDVSGAHTFRLDNSDATSFQLGAGDMCRQDAFENVSDRLDINPIEPLKLDYIVTMDLEKDRLYPLKIVHFPQGKRIRVAIMHKDSRAESEMDITDDILQYRYDDDHVSVASISTSNSSKKACDPPFEVKKGLKLRVFDSKSNEKPTEAQAYISGYRMGKFKYESQFDRISNAPRIYDYEIEEKAFGLELKGYFRISHADTYTFTLRANGISSLQVGPGVPKLRLARFEDINESWVKLDSRAPKLKKRDIQIDLNEDLYYPIRAVVISDSLNAKLDFSVKDSQGKMVDFSEVIPFDRKGFLKELPLDPTIDEGKTDLSGMTFDVGNKSSENSYDQVLPKDKLAISTVQPGAITENDVNPIDVNASTSENSASPRDALGEVDYLNTQLKSRVSSNKTSSSDAVMNANEISIPLIEGAIDGDLYQAISLGTETSNDTLKEPSSDGTQVHIAGDIAQHASETNDTLPFAKVDKFREVKANQLYTKSVDKYKQVPVVECTASVHNCPEAPKISEHVAGGENATEVSPPFEQARIAESEHAQIATQGPTDLGTYSMAISRNESDEKRPNNPKSSGTLEGFEYNEFGTLQSALPDSGIPISSPDLLPVKARLIEVGGEPSVSTKLSNQHKVKLSLSGCPHKETSASEAKYYFGSHEVESTKTEELCMENCPKNLEACSTSLRESPLKPDEHAQIFDSSMLSQDNEPIGARLKNDRAGDRQDLMFGKDLVKIGEEFQPISGHRVVSTRPEMGFAKASHFEPLLAHHPHLDLVDIVSPASPEKSNGMAQARINVPSNVDIYESQAMAINFGGFKVICWNILLSFAIGI